MSVTIQEAKELKELKKITEQDFEDFCAYKVAEIKEAIEPIERARSVEYFNTYKNMYDDEEFEFPGSKPLNNPK